MRRTVVITGATGFIGRHLVPHLVNLHYEVHVVGRDSRKLFGTAVTYHIAPTAEQWRTLANAGTIVHLAGTIDINASLQEPRTRIEENLAPLFDVLDASRTVEDKPLIIYTSTDRLYGRTTKKRVAETEPAYPIEPYTASKIMGEVLLQTYANLYDIPHITLRLDSVYGPGQPRSMFISDVINKLMKSDTIETGPLTTKKNFVFVGDVVLAIEKAIRAPKRARNQIYNIGDTLVSLRDVLGHIKSIMSNDGTRKIRVHEKKTVARPTRIEVPPFQLSLSKAHTLLGWRPKTPLYKGLTKTIEYFNTYENKS